MTNNSKQICNLLMASKRLTPTFAQALHKHPNTKRFSIVATKSEHVFTFVPAHLERFAPSDAKLASINRPQNLTEKNYRSANPPYVWRFVQSNATKSHV